MTELTKKLNADVAGVVGAFLDGGASSGISGATLRKETKKFHQEFREKWVPLWVMKKADEVMQKACELAKENGAESYCFKLVESVTDEDDDNEILLLDNTESAAEDAYVLKNAPTLGPILKEELEKRGVTCGWGYGRNGNRHSNNYKMKPFWARLPAGPLAVPCGLGGTSEGPEGLFRWVRDAGVNLRMWITWEDEAQRVNKDCGRLFFQQEYLQHMPEQPEAASK